jgi:hypothetical protein
MDIILQRILKMGFQKNIEHRKGVERYIFLVLCCIAFFVSPLYAADLIISPSKGVRHVGETFSIDVYVSNNQDPINAVSSNIAFSNDTLELIAIKKIGSILTMWAEEPLFSNVEGKASFEGVILNPGFNGVQGKLISLTFQVKKPGIATVALSNGQVLANDGEATNVLNKLSSASFVLEATSTENDDVATVAASLGVGAPVITSSTHPDSTSWYKSREATFSWQLPPDVTSVKTLYDAYENSYPTRIYDPPIAEKAITVDTGGVQYMHVQYRNAIGWGPVSHYAFRVDYQPPFNLKVDIIGGATTTSPKPTVLITATDTVSGIGSIGITIDNDKEIIYPYTVSNLYILPKKHPGFHTMSIHVYDKAGNYAAATLPYTITAINPPTITDYTKRVELKGVLFVKGTTYPFAIVEVQLEDKNNNKIIETSTADENGNYSVVWQKTLEAGAYEMRVRAIDSRGGVSDFTETRVITLEHIPLIRFGIFIMNWLSLILICVVSSTLVFATLWYSFVQFFRFRRKVRRTMHDAEMTLKSNVLALRRDTEEFHTLLVKAEKKRELTKEEVMILKKFKKRLDITEKEIEKKLEQIS